MKTYINEVFSSIQGEGILIGRRQIFVRFSGCNLDCNYCDTPHSRDPNHGKQLTIEDLEKKVDELITPDFHSLSLTGGEPLLHADFLKKFLEKSYKNSLLETNGSLPEELKKIVSLIKFASVDIKLPEHSAISNWNDLFHRELESINVLIKEDINTYCKLIVFPTTELDTLDFIATKIAQEVDNRSNISLIIQPASPLDNWIKNQHKLLQMSEITGKHLEVRVIPQIHKILEIR